MIVKAKVSEVTEAFRDTKSKLLLRVLEEGKRVFALKLPNFKGLLGFNLLPNRRIGTELADLVKRFGLRGILHSDELPAYGISELEVEKVKKLLSCEENDAFVLILVENEEKAKTIFKHIVNRLNEMIEKIPKDTRKANEDGTTSFLRPQPGSARMYPETDLPLILVDRKEIDRSSYKEIVYKITHGDKVYELKLARLKEKNIDLYLKLKENEDLFVLDSLDPEFRREVLKKLGFNESQIENILWSDNPDLFEKYARKLKPSLIYYIYFMLPSEVESEFGEKVYPDEDFIEQAADLISKKLITRDALKILLYEYSKTRKPLKEIIEEKGLKKVSGSELENKIDELLSKYKNLEKKKLINKILSELRLIADPKEIIEIVNRKLK
jgi:glutamyl-tRNA(Gln) amidotransferase subunit E